MVPNALRRVMAFLSKIRTCFVRQTSYDKEETVYKPVIENKDEIESIRSFFRKRRELLVHLGDARGKRMYMDHIRQSDYVLVYAEANDAEAQLIRQKLEQSAADVVVAGPWSVAPGEDILPRLEHIIRTSTTVLVLVSEALCNERMPAITSMAAMMDERILTVIPVFIENIPNGALPDGLNMLSYRQGVDPYRDGYDACVAEIARHTSVTKRYIRETAVLKEYLDLLRRNGGLEA